MGAAQSFVDKEVDTISFVLTSSGAGTTSAAVQYFGCTPALLITPATLTASSITFMVSVDGAKTFNQLRNADGTAVTLSVAASGCYVLDKNTFAGTDALKVVTGIAEAASRTFILKPFSI